MVGALLGVFARLTHGVIARTTSSGAGLLLAAASVELAAEVIKHSPYLGIAVMLIGAVSFSAGNALLSSQGAHHRKRCGECVTQPSEAEMPNSGMAIAMGTAMDAVPEALSASSGMREANRTISWILGLWGAISLATALLTGAGFALAGVLSEDAAPYLQAFGAGALLAMVSETLLPEAAHEGPAFSGLVTALGFAALLLLGAVM
jgi:zinc transporter, ZIP family